MPDNQKPIETVSDITRADISRCCQIFEAIARAGALNPVKNVLLKALDMDEFFDGVTLKLFTHINLDNLEE